MAQTGTSLSDKFRDRQALHKKDLDIYYPIGSILHITMKCDKTTKKFYAEVTGDYEHFINVKVDGPFESYILSLNKRDIAIKESIKIRRVK